jgi:hypothetical protein
MRDSEQARRHESCFPRSRAPDYLRLDGLEFPLVHETCRGRRYLPFSHFKLVPFPGTRRGLSFASNTVNSDRHFSNFSDLSI